MLLCSMGGLLEHKVSKAPGRRIESWPLGLKDKLDPCDIDGICNELSGSEQDQGIMRIYSVQFMTAL